MADEPTQPGASAEGQPAEQIGMHGSSNGASMTGSGTGTVGRGLLIGLAATFGGSAGLVLIGSMLGTIGELIMFAPLAVGVVQLLWVVPMLMHYRKTGKTETAKGIVIFAAITFLLNAACWGLLATADLDFR